MKKLFRKTWFQILLIVLLTIPTFASLMRPGFFPMQDDLQAFRILEMGKCFADLQIPCHWIPDMGYQYGYPQFLFYSPSVYYLGAFIHLFGIQIIDVVKILFALGFALGALAMFGFLKSWLGTKPAFLGAILYSYVPFKAAQVYVRGSLSEFWAALFFPLLFWFSMDLILKKEKKYGIFFALAVGGLLITHNLMSFIFFPVLAVWILLWLHLDREKLGSDRKLVSDVGNLAKYGLLGVGLSAFFVIPLIAERQFVHTESLLGGYFDYRQHFVNISQLFLSNYWGYGSSVLGDGDEVTLSAGSIQWVLGALSFISILVLLRKNKPIIVISSVLVFLELGVLFLMHQKSSFIWSLIPAMAWLQFPWRILALNSFLLAVLGSMGIFVLNNNLKEKWNIGLIVAIFVLLLAMYGSFFVPREWFALTDNEKFSGQSWEKQLTISIFDYLPKSAEFPPNKKAPELPEVLDGKAEFTNYQKHSNFQNGTIVVQSAQSVVRLPIYDFPGMKLRVDGVESPFWNNDCRGEEFCFGLITSQFSQGTHTIKVGLTNTPVRTTGNIISVLSLSALIYWAKKKGIFRNEKN